MATTVDVNRAPAQWRPLETSSLVRWSGVAAIAAALLIAQTVVFHPDEGPEGFASPAWVPTHFAFYMGYVFVQLALVGILARQFHAARFGRLGVVGFLVAFLGAGFTLMEGRDHTFSLPILRLAGLQGSDPGEMVGLWSLLLNAILFSVGHILLGVATFRAGVFPPAAAVLVGLGGPILAFSPPIGFGAAVAGCALYGAGLLWLGYALLATPVAGSTPHSRSRPGVDMHERTQQGSDRYDT